MSVRSRPESSKPARPLIEALGDQALVVVFGSTVDPLINERVCLAADAISSGRPQGVTDVVPSFAAVTVHYTASEVVTAKDELPFESLSRQIGDLLAERPTRGRRSASSSVIEIPVCYGGAFGPDLDDAARHCGISAAELVALHQQAAALRVYMIGFAPGAPYIGQFDERLSIPRRSTPRVSVPAGTIGLANRQSVIYPVVAPGGWSLIGRTPLHLFDATLESPSLLQPGSLVRFRSITEDELMHWSPT